MKIIQPNQSKHSCVQIWKGTPEKVFPLLCPVRETEWIPDWNPKLVVSNSGLMELDCVFVEPASPDDAIWVVTGYKPNSFVEMYRILPELTVSKFSIKLIEEVEGTTRALISYGHTALGKKGDDIVKNFTVEAFNELMGHFESAINCFLTTGNKIQ